MSWILTSFMEFENSNAAFRWLFPNPAQRVLRSRPIMREREQAGHLHYFTKETALATLKDAGHEIIDWYYTPGAIANPRSIKAQLASWPRKLLSMMNQDLVVRILGGYPLLVLAE
jgi:hypothetical protein